MSTHVCRACAGFLFLVSLASYVGAKPPDLPLELKVSLEEAPETTPTSSVSVRAGLSLFGGFQVDVNFTRGEPESCSAALDVVSPCLYSALHELLQAALALESAKPEQARRMFEIGERCQRGGDLDMAYSCFREAMLISPQSRYAQKAQEHVRRIEERRAAEEASEVNDGQIENRVSGQGHASLLEQARRMYLKAERSRTAGDLDRAYIRFQQTHLICPDSPYGRKAMERVQEIELQRAAESQGAAEEQEEPVRKKRKEERRIKKLLESTEPLGLFLEDYVSSDEAGNLFGVEIGSGPVIHRREAKGQAGAGPALPIFFVSAPPYRLILQPD